MPDISQIVPLSKILVTSTDALLGAEISEEEEIDSVFNELDQLYHPTDYYYNAGEEGAQFVKLSYYRLSALVRKYPTNIRLLRCCAWNGVNYIECSLIWEHFRLSEKELNTVFRDVERKFKTMISFTENVSEKINAKEGLAFVYTFMGRDNDASEIIRDIPDTDRSYTEYCLACKRKDLDRRIYHIKNTFDYVMEEMITTFRQMAKSYSIMGEKKREYAIKVFNKYAQFIRTMRGTIDSSMFYREMIWVYKYLAVEYIRSGNFEDALSNIEIVTRLCEESYTDVLRFDESNQDITVFSGKNISNTEKSSDSDKFKEKLLIHLRECWHECDDKENNPIVTSHRYKKCVERIESL